MSATSSLSEYLLLIRNNAWYHNLSSGELEEAMKRFTAWFEKLKAEGKYQSSAPLAAVGKTIISGHVVTDGPFAESKEAVAGFFVVQAGSLDAAAEIARGCPGLEYGQTVEVRAFAVDAFENEKARLKAGD
jgi:hypothetical protein